MEHLELVTISLRMFIISNYTQSLECQDNLRWSYRAAFYSIFLRPIEYQRYWPWTQIFVLVGLRNHQLDPS